MTKQACPERIAAFCGYADSDGKAVAYMSYDPNGYTITDWQGFTLGRAICASKWRVQSYLGSHMHQFYAHIGGREYTGRGFGAGMSVVLRETAASKRKRAQ